MVVALPFQASNVIMATSLNHKTTWSDYNITDYNKNDIIASHPLRANLSDVPKEWNSDAAPLLKF